jgi:iron(III) transport system ATP-binding protein
MSETPAPGAAVISLSPDGGAAAKPSAQPAGQAVSVRGLTKRYGDSVAVRSLSLDVTGGEFLTLLGPSGCGKTTTLRCIAGLETANEGRILFGDDVIVDCATKTEVPVHRRDVGMVFQSYALWPHMNVFGNVAYPLRVARVTKAMIAPRVGDALALVGLAGYEQRPVSALSGGQQQRVALARALVRSPRVLLLDEPLSNLDASLRAQMRTELRRIHEQTGKATVYVTHDQLEAATLSDRVVVMKDGDVIQVGAPQEIFTRPRSSWVAAFLGFDNILPATVRAADAGGIVARPRGWEVNLTCPPVPEVAVGQQIAIALRSTAVTLADAGAPTRPNSFEASVRRRTYLGNLTEFKLEAFGTEVTASAPDSGVPASRERVTVHIPAENIAIVPADPSERS